jgi:hypothetical protein
MKIISLLLLLISGWAWLAAWVGPANSAQQVGAAAIQAPRPGEALQGVLAILGSTQVDGFASAELAFAYSRDTSGTWFILAQSQKPVENGFLASWDTTTITDSNYDLRLTVRLQDGSSQVVQVSGLRVRNYTPVETATPTAQPSAAASPAATATLTPTPRPTPVRPTPTRLATNPASVLPGDIQNGFLWGGLAAFSFFAVLGIYLGIQSLIRHRSG